jgi:hypothetical protein
MANSEYSSIDIKNIDDENAGRYRQQNVLISGATTNPPDYTLLNDKDGSVYRLV